MTASPAASASRAVCSRAVRAALARSSGVAARDRALRAREREQRLDEALGAVQRVVDGFGHRAQLRVGGLRVGERHLELGAHDGQRRAQLVRRVGHEAPLAGEGAGQALEHRVEGVGQLLELVARALQRDALVERVLRDAAAPPR